MWFSGRLTHALILGCSLIQVGCCCFENRSLQQCQYRSFELYKQGQMTQAELEMARQENMGLMAEKQKLEQDKQQLAKDMDELKALQAQLDALKNQSQEHINIANQRIGLLKDERGELQRRYMQLLSQLRPGVPMLPADLMEQFQELARKHPNFEFDPDAGIGRFHADLNFDVGSAVVKPQYQTALRDLANLLNDAKAQNLNILVCGHTDDQPIVREATRNIHPTNWHLSTNRANSVIQILGHFGVAGERMGAAGYSMYQPLVSNTDPAAQQKNRRVEIYFLADEAVIAGRQPKTTTK